MRLILALLALVQTRWALADLERSRMLDRHSAEALRRGEQRMQHAYSLMGRAQAAPADPWAPIISGFTAIAVACVALAVVVASLIVRAVLTL